MSHPLIGKYVRIEIAGRLMFEGILTDGILKHISLSYPASNLHIYELNK